MQHKHHSPEHSHSHAPNSFGFAFAVGATLNLALVLAELAFGVLSNSLALISDGVHNFSNVLGLLLAWGGSWLATRQPSASRTYGYRRASILAAFGNAALLLVATGGLLVEAVQRLFDASPVASGTVLWVATAAIAINTVTALLFNQGDLLIIKKLCGVALSAEDVGEEIEILVEGCLDLPEGDCALALGSPAHWDMTAKRIAANAQSNILIGIAIGDTPREAQIVRVRLDGFIASYAPGFPVLNWRLNALTAG